MWLLSCPVPDDVTYYELLNVSPSATPGEIRSAYRQAMRTVHPDVGGNAGMFRLVTTAYETLIDPDARARYDRHLSGAGAGVGHDTSAGPATDAGDFTPSDDGADLGAETDWGWGHEWVYDPDAPPEGSRRSQFARSHRGRVTIIVCSSIAAVLGLALAIMLIVWPEVLRPDAAQYDVMADLISVWWATLLVALFYGTLVVGSIVEGDPVEFLMPFDALTGIGFLWWIGAYWDIATGTEWKIFFVVVGAWVIYRVSVLIAAELRSYH